MVPSEFACNLIRDAGLLAKSYFDQRDQLTVTNKGPQDFVSEADCAVEAFIKGRLKAQCPLDGCVGEESGLSTGVRQWIIDPIDGTTNFLRGIPVFCTTLALVEGDTTLGGWIYNPNTDELYMAIRGEGATCNGTPIQSRWKSRFAEALVGFCHSSLLTPEALGERMTRALAAGAMIRQPGAGALLLCDLAMGRIDALFDQHLKPWDSVAGLLIAHEAGAIASDYLANPNWRAQPQPTLAMGPLLYAELTAVWPEAASVVLLKPNR